MMTKEQMEVYKANENFYSAFESLEIEKMEKVWLKESTIQCFHPGWGLLRGWEPVMASWRRIFENTEEMHFILTDVQVEVRNSLAWVTLYENLTSREGKELSTGSVVATNIFEKRQDGWFLIHHHGSPVVQAGQLSPSTFH